LKELVQQRATQEDLDSIWNDLSHLQAQCMQLKQSPAEVVNLLRNQDLVGRIQDKQSLLQLANTLNRDMQDFSARLDQLNQTADRYRGSSVDVAVMSVLLDTAQAYDQWITSYQLVVIPTAIQITDLFNQINQAPQV